MHIINKELLDEFIEAHAEARQSVSTWFQFALHTTWATPQEIKTQFASASFLPNNRVVFNIKGNKYRLVVLVNYRIQTLQIDWIGTHSEYSKRRFE